MVASVPSFLWPVVFGADVALVAVIVAAVRRHGGSHARRRACTVAALLGSWFVVAIALSATGVFVGGANRPPAIGLGVFPPILVGALALASSRQVRAAALAIPQAWLVGVQSLRALGVVFLVLFARGVLPRQFALPAGWGDLAIGLAAPAVAYALWRGGPSARPLALVWNLLGVLDLAVAIGMGALSAESAIRVFASGPSSAAMARLPLSMIPTFAVPVFVLLHVVSLLGLRSPPARAAREAVRRASAAVRAAASP